MTRARPTVDTKPHVTPVGPLKDCLFSCPNVSALCRDLSSAVGCFSVTCHRCGGCMVHRWCTMPHNLGSFPKGLGARQFDLIFIFMCHHSAAQAHLPKYICVVAYCTILLYHSDPTQEEGESITCIIIHLSLVGLLMPPKDNKVGCVPDQTHEEANHTPPVDHDSAHAGGGAARLGELFARADNVCVSTRLGTL